MQPRPGDIYSFRLHGGGYGAAQIMRTAPDSHVPHVIVPFDLISDAPPTLETAVNSPLLCPQWRGGSPDRYYTSGRVPWWMTHLGRIEPATYRGHLLPIGSWNAVVEAAPCARWNRPSMVEDRVAQGLKDAVPIRIDWNGKVVEGTTDGMAIDVPSLWPEGDAPDGATLDLSVTGLFWLRINTTQPITIDLPATIKQVSLSGAHHLVKLNLPHPYEPFTLHLEGGGGELTGVPLGLEGLHQIELSDFAKLDVARLASLGSIASVELLQIQGALTHLEALARLRNLRSFEGYELYDFDANAFPELSELPALDSVWIDGLRADSAKILRRRLKGLPELHLSRARGEKWLAANIDNPFRDWDVVNRAIAKGAAKLWSTAVAQALEVREKPSKEQGVAVVTSLVEGLNQLNVRYEMTDAERDDAFDAVQNLARKYLAKVLSVEEAEQLVEELRNF
jgi:hypothetical protein